MGMMRIAFTSDLHADITVENQKLLPYLAEEFSLEPDAVVLAGDIANSLSGWKGALTISTRSGSRSSSFRGIMTSGLNRRRL
jgi:Icc-related predicted phosphoesterase